MSSENTALTVKSNVMERKDVAIIGAASTAVGVWNGFWAWKAAEGILASLLAGGLAFIFTAFPLLVSLLTLAVSWSAASSGQLFTGDERENIKIGRPAKLVFWILTAIAGYGLLCGGPLAWTAWATSAGGAWAFRRLLRKRGRASRLLTEL